MSLRGLSGSTAVILVGGQWSLRSRGDKYTLPQLLIHTGEGKTSGRGGGRVGGFGDEWGGGTAADTRTSHRCQIRDNWAACA